MRSVWSRWILVAAFLLASVGTSTSTAQSQFDVRGRWDVHVWPMNCKKDCRSYDHILTITRQDPVTGALTGTYKIPATKRLTVGGKIAGAEMTLWRTDLLASGFIGTLVLDGDRLTFEGMGFEGGPGTAGGGPWHPDRCRSSSRAPSAAHGPARPSSSATGT